MLRTYIEPTDRSLILTQVRQSRGATHIQKQISYPLQEGESLLEDQTTVIRKTVEELVPHIRGELLLILSESQVVHRLFAAEENSIEQAVNKLLEQDPDTPPESTLWRTLPAEHGQHHLLAVPASLVEMFVNAFEAAGVPLMGIYPRLGFLLSSDHCRQMIDLAGNRLMLLNRQDSDEWKASTVFIPEHETAETVINEEWLRAELPNLIQDRFSRLDTVCLNRRAGLLEQLTDVLPEGYSFELIDETPAFQNLPWGNRDLLWNGQPEGDWNFYSWHAEEKTRRRQVRQIALLIALLGIVWFSWNVLTVGFQSRGCANRIQTLRAQIAAAEADVVGYDRFVRIQELHDRLATLLNRIRYDQPDWYPVLHSLGDVIPPATILTGVSYQVNEVVEQSEQGNQSKARQPSLSISGQVYDSRLRASGHLTELLNHLEAEDNFGSVFAVHSEMKTPGLMNFDFQVILAREGMVKK